MKGFVSQRVMGGGTAINNQSLHTAHLAVAALLPSPSGSALAPWEEFCGLCAASQWTCRASADFNASIQMGQMNPLGHNHGGREGKQGGLR